MTKQEAEYIILNHIDIEDFIQKNIALWYEPDCGYDDNSIKLAAIWKEAERILKHGEILS